jgi:hypothetical protein
LQPNPQSLLRGRLLPDATQNRLKRSGQLHALRFLISHFPQDALRFRSRALREQRLDVQQLQRPRRHPLVARDHHETRDQSAALGCG